MPLHRKKSLRQPGRGVDTDIFASNVSAECLPRYVFPQYGSSARASYQLVRDELFMDGNSRQNLATFCTTWVEDEVHQLMSDCLDKNMIDKDEYPQTAEIEARCVHMIAALWNSPEAGDTVGCSTTGSSEAAMLGGLALKWRWRKRREENGNDNVRPNLICGPVQVCWHKFARYFDVELREVPLDDDEVCMNPDKISEYADENTIGVVATLGVTFTCVYEPVEAIADALDKLQEARGLDIPIHVDAASGGFVAPFVQPDLKWDFRIPRVKSINTSGHKYGLAPLGVGWVVWRDVAELPEDLVFRVDYLGGDMPTFALNFSRPGGEIVAQYYNFMRLGFEGYKKVQQYCADTAQWLGRNISELGPFELFYNGHGGLPAISYTMKEGDWDFNLYDLSDRLRIRGWQIASYPLPANRQDCVIQRIMIRHGVSRDMASLLFDDIRRAVEYFKEHPVTRSAGQPGFSHTGRKPDG
ncbi:glutamate decarboxylase [Microbulbifer litoralis]|uniref:glutamate decarboxylase n=1 Tax=Microbulbifer litoralis TaxID=2933965 RepID=UPI0020281497|nr:glutamate decarboxylase [Microbulbifer sp. GX H0434]